MRAAVLLGLLVGFLPARVGSAAPAKKGIDPKAPFGVVGEGVAADGLAFQWRAPRRYDPEQGVGLTVILHGSNLSRTWGFANHPRDAFRPDDLVVVPDGTTPNGKGGSNFLGEPKDGKRLAALLDEVKKTVKVRGTYLYGHSQGSFFALWFAGERPDAVDGVVAHASGVWTSTKLGKDGHRQAIVLMHGTQDPVVPYVQSVGGLPTFLEAGYPTARLRPLEFWNHWPAETNSAGGTPHTSQQLAWAEGMTTSDPDRLASCLEVLCDVKDKVEHDWAGLYALARRAATAPFAKDATKSKATKAADVVEALARRHADALAAPKPGAPFDGKPWCAHLPVFLRQFAGVPACDALVATWKDELARHRERGIAALRKHYAAKGKDPAAAFDAGLQAIREGFLWCEVQDRAFRDDLAAIAKDPKKAKLSKKAVKDAVVLEEFGEAWKKGFEAYAGACRSAGDL